MGVIKEGVSEWVEAWFGGFWWLVVVVGEWALRAYTQFIL